MALLLAYAVHRFVERPLSRALRNGLKSSFQKARAASEPSGPDAVPVGDALVHRQRPDPIR
ncbi:hypothetical protein [Micromonospora echinofusca]|uniref:hypothetical protein n=1 Tax=Micromonospora echinofusca TaxID=47858 RepID=UPI000B5AD7F9|nr:hypothetical protein [Micromonospora echinofusca]